MTRARAVRSALFYGLAPYRLYERVPHYAPMRYRAHAAMNLALAWRWITLRETADDRAFEQDVNGNGG